jgi:hypothetical protein
MSRSSARCARPARAPRPLDDRPTEPFTSVEEAWFWSLAAKLARDEGARPKAGEATTPRPCEPLEVVHLAERLHREGRLSPVQWKVMLAFGRAFIAPDPRLAGQRRLAAHWRAGLEALGAALKAKGILA